MTRKRITRPTARRPAQALDPVPVPNSDDEIATLARRYRKDSLAALVSVIRDPRAPASARAQAASKLLEYSDGRPQQARALTTADLDALSSEQRTQLWCALFEKFEADQPGMIKEMFEESCITALREKETRSMRYTAGMPQPQQTRLPRPQSGGTVEPVPEVEVEPAHVHARAPEPVPASPPQPDNVLPLPRGVHPTIRGQLDNPPDTFGRPGSNSAPNNRAPNGVHPDVLTRSTRPGNGMALDGDITFRDYRRDR